MPDTRPEGKVTFGLRSCYVAKLTIGVDESTGTETYTYGTPIRWLGAVSLTMDAATEESTFAADDNPRYWSAWNNSGRTGTLEIASVPQAVRTAIFRDTVDANGVLVESDEEPYPFALIWEQQTDKLPERFVLYNCMASKPGMGSSTKTNQTTPNTRSISLTARLRNGKPMSASTTQNVNAETFAGWFSQVYEST